MHTRVRAVWTLGFSEFLRPGWIVCVGVEGEIYYRFSDYMT